MSNELRFTPKIKHLRVGDVLECTNTVSRLWYMGRRVCITKINDERITYTPITDKVMQPNHLSGYSVGRDETLPNIDLIIPSVPLTWDLLHTGMCIKHVTTGEEYVIARVNVISGMVTINDNGIERVISHDSFMFFVIRDAFIMDNTQESHQKLQHLKNKANSINAEIALCEKKLAELKKQSKMLDGDINIVENAISIMSRIEVDE